MSEEAVMSDADLDSALADFAGTADSDQLEELLSRSIALRF